MFLKPRVVRKATWRRRWQRALAQQEARAGGPATRVGHLRGPGRRAGQCHFTLLGSATLQSRAVGRSPRSAEDLFLQNKISGLEAFNASVAAQVSGARGVADFAGGGHHGKWKGNLARDVRRAFLKEVKKPNVYWARIPCKDLATGAAKTPTWCPFLLVHEMLASLVEMHAGDVSSFAAIPQQFWGVKRNFCAKHGINDDLTLGLGLHGDGVAHQKRTTVECFSWNVLGSRSGRRLGRDTICFLFPVCVSALVCLCVCSSVPCVHVQLCFVSPAGPGSSARS